MDELQSGDELLVWKLDRLGRSSISLINNLKTLIERGVRVVAISNGMKFDKADAFSTFTYQLLSILSELEAGIISERTRAGLSNAKAKGIRLGARPKIRQRNRIQKMRDKGMKLSAIAEKIGVSRQAVSKMIRRMDAEAA